MLFRTHSSACCSCIFNIFPQRKYIQAVGPWQSCTHNYYPITLNPVHVEHERTTCQLTYQYTSPIRAPFLCLANEEGFQWPQVLIVEPKSKLWARDTNDFTHTLNAVPTRESLCTKTFTMCSKRTFCVAGTELHLSHFPSKHSFTA